MQGITQIRKDSRISVVFLLLFSALLSIFSAGTARATDATFKAVATHARPLAQLIKEGESVDTSSVGKHFLCQDLSATVRCYSPAQIRNAYNVTPLLDAGYAGQGRTIVIIDAYQSPTIAGDLKIFDKVFGLSDPTLNIIAPNGLTPFSYKDTNQVGWAGEITLDVEWAHAIAPGATIDLVLARSSDDPAILNATRYAINNNLGDVLSQSFGEGEACSSVQPAIEHQLFQQATNQRMTLFASSGDNGAAQASQTTPPACGGSNGTYYRSASTPASDPLVTGVGATYLNAATDGSYIGESAWNDSYGASGGGYSNVYARPQFQQSVVQESRRGIPDVAYDGDVNGGVITVESDADGKANVSIAGGTSAGAPQWAGITALADQLAGTRLGCLNEAIYQIGTSVSYHWAFHDIKVGNNSYQSTDNKGNSTNVAGYNTTSGWDAVTGWGTPDVAHLLPLLVAIARSPF